MSAKAVDSFVIKTYDPNTEEWDLWMDTANMTADEMVAHTRKMFGDTAMKRHKFALFQRHVHPGKAPDEFRFVRRIYRTKRKAV